ncbi:HepT-like ribonuclease domain-containing protein [Rathayibacter sp. CAU 1779]
MAIIRLKALTEVPDFAPFFRVLDDEQLAGLTRVRNIAAHGGYLAMNDDILWDVVTQRLEPILDVVEKLVREGD